MNKSTKTIITCVFLGTLLSPEVVKAVYHNQLKAFGAVMAEYHPSNENHKQEPSDGDGEASDDTETPEPSNHNPHKEASDDSK